MLAVALPNAGLLQAGNMLGAALGAAYNAIRPPERNHLRLAVLETTKVDDCLLKSLDAVHVLRIRLFVWSVKYIIALVSRHCHQHFKTIAPYLQLLTALRPRISRSAVLQ